jgi:hypothetical protein
MKRIALGLLLAAGAGFCAHADPLAGLYGNTATSTGPNGKTTSYYFNADGTFENRFSSGRSIKGTFTWKDAQTACFTVTDPPPAKGENATNCRAFPVAHHVGDTWVEKDSEGVAYTNAVVAGRH